MKRYRAALSGDFIKKPASSLMIMARLFTFFAD